jgi:phenylacetate-CoA ligase
MPGMLQTIDTKLKRLDFGERFVRRNPIYYGAARRTFLGLRSADLLARRRWTQTRLRKILSVAAQTAYGREVGGSEQVHRWPLLEKDRVREQAGAFRGSTAWLAARASTGGTTGMPLELLRSAESIVVEQACLDVLMQELGADARAARIAVLRGDNIKDPDDLQPPFWETAVGGRRLLMSSNHLSAATLPPYIDALRSFAPDVLWVYPSAIEHLCALLVAAGTKLPIPRVLSSSEVLQSESWSLIDAALGARIADYYGQAERVAFAYSLAPREYRFLPGYAYVELLPQETEGEWTSYEIVGTSLWNTAMPLVRYRTGDLIRVPATFGERELDEITFGIRTFDGVIGRDKDVLYARDADGTIKVLTGIDHIQRQVAHVIRLQVVQEALDRVLLRVLPGVGYTQADSEHLLRNARKKIPHSIDVRVECVAALEHTSRLKTPFVIHRPSVREAIARPYAPVDSHT